MEIKRRKSRKIWVGNVPVGGDAPISVQSMLKVPVYDTKNAVVQIRKVQEAGCKIMRVAVPDMRSAQAIGAVKKQIQIPIVADIHFAPRLAVAAIENGADKIRLNPGNTRSSQELREVVMLAKKKGIPIRVGVNSGSVDTNSGKKDFSKKNKQLLSCRMSAKAMEYISFFEKLRFKDIIISLKAADISSTIDSYVFIAGETEYPLHLGLTATGPFLPALIKSSISIGNLLLRGIGDTLRVSLTSEPANEVRAGYEILKALNLLNSVEIISCPTCGRCKVKLEKMVNGFEKIVNTEFCNIDLKRSLKIAIMGCEVNGPGEAKDADLGIAFSGTNAIVFKHGKPAGKIEYCQALKFLESETKKLIPSKMK